MLKYEKIQGYNIQKKYALQTHYRIQWMKLETKIRQRMIKTENLCDIF